MASVTSKVMSVMMTAIVVRVQYVVTMDARKNVLLLRWDH